MSGGHNCCIHESRAALPAPGRTPRLVHVTFRLAILAVSCWPAICSASPPQVRRVRLPIVDRADMPFTHVSFETAPVRGIVERMVQDDQGFLWFGTNHGLLRYDGYTFRPFNHDPEDPNSISGVNILALFKDRSGNLWIGSGSHLDRYDPASGIFKHFLLDASNACGLTGVVRDITQDREGMIWVATDNGLKRLNPATSKVNCYQHQTDDASSIASNFVKTMLESRDGTLWVATTLGLESLDRSTGHVKQRVILRGPSGTPFSLDGNKISLFEDHAGVLWITIPAGQEYGLASFDPHSGIQTVYWFGNGPADIVFSILEDEDQALWLGQWQRGMIRLDRDRQRAIRYHNSPNDLGSISTGAVVSLLQDRDHRIWAGFDPPIVDSFDPRPSPFHTYRHDPDDPNSLSNAVVSVLLDSRGILWIGRLDGLDRVDRKTGQVTRYADKYVSNRLAFKTVHAIAEDRAGYLWFGEWGNGLDRFDPRTGDVKVYRHDPNNPTSLSDDIVESLLVDRKGTLWIGTFGALNRFDPKTERFTAYQSAVPGLSQYRAIAEDSDGALWLASLGNGLHRFDPASGQFTVYQNAPADPRSLSNDIVNSVYVDRSGTVWAGTSDGLCKLDQSSGTFTSYYARDGLASSVVEGILEDERGNLWLSTSDGLSRFNPGAKAFRNYYAGDGLLGNEFRFAAASKSLAGEMFFGSTSGLLEFVPNRVIDDRSIPPVMLTDFQLFGKPVQIGARDSPLKQSISFAQSMTLKYWQNIFSFEFSALSYSNPKRNRYRYKLEGLDSDWNETDSTRRFMSYTTLAPGEYLFRVQGSNSHGIWNEQGASVRLLILPPWWNTWRFRAVALAFLLMSLAYAYHLRIQIIERQFNARLEARVGERTRIARELHDTLLQGFHGLMFRLHAARTMFPRRPEEAMQVLDGAITAAEHAIAEGRDAIQDLRSSTEISNELAEAVTSLAGELASDNSAKFHMVVRGSPRDLHPILRDEIYGIAREAVRNAFRHADARNIEAEITYGERLFGLRIRDDGKGIDPEIAGKGRPGHYGLTGMRERAQRIGGQLNFWTGNRVGTEIELNIPGRIAYGTSAARTVLGLFRTKADRTHEHRT
jgi:signal transduction histidine kinase/ligand-binding sensor domain-containing protein